MRVFYDTEFIERGPQLPLQPISFGFVAEDGRELYLINEESLSNAMRHPWISVNVAPRLPISNDQVGNDHYITQWDSSHPEYPFVLPLEGIEHYVRKFLTEIPGLELWADYGAYDHVVLCQLFGTMADLPTGIPMFTHELQQLIEQYPTAKLPADPPVSHHALWDARWARDAFDAVNVLIG